MQTEKVGRGFGERRSPKREYGKRKGVVILAANRKYYQDYEELCELLNKSSNEYDREKIDRAYRLAEKMHGDQRRVSGVPYILHPTSVACIIVDLGMDTDSVVAALLHDVVEDTPVTLDEVRQQFGEDVAHLVDGVTKISKIAYTEKEERQAENVRKMLIAMADDIRVIIIKLADRLHNMRTIDCMREQKRRDIALETMEVFAPIAHRLGIKAIKDEMEDLSLQYLDPIGYKEIETYLENNIVDGQGFIRKIIEQIRERVDKYIKGAIVSGRVKSIHGIYKKLIVQGKSLQEIYDIYAVRVIVDDSRKTIGRFTRGGWGKESIHLYVKDPDNGWTAFSSDICTTTQKNFYAFVFMLPATDKYYNAEFAISPSMPVEVSEEITNADGTKSTITRDMVDGVEITKMRITSGNQYRFNTCYSLDDPKCFTVDTSVETKSYAGTEITKGDNSPTSELNQFIGMTVGKKFVINFKYDTTVNYDGQSYKIFAGAYTIDDKYSGFYTDFAPGATKETATKSGIDLYTENAKKFFTQKNNEGYMNYGVKSATGYSPWATNKVNSGKDLDIMTNNISKTGDVVASEKDNRVNFRYNGEKGSDTLKVDRNITLKGSVISIAANVIDFRSSGAADFTIESGTFIFLTDTEIKKADGTTSVINHGTYVFNTKNTDKKTMKVSLKSTSDPETDWRSKFSLVSDIGSELEGGKFIANN